MKRRFSSIQWTYVPFVASLLLLCASARASAFSAAQQDASYIGAPSAAQSADAISVTSDTASDPAIQEQPQSETQAQPEPQQAPARTQLQAPSTAEQKNEEYQRQTGTSKDRLGFVLPNFLTIEGAGTVPRLTWQQKFKAQARSSFDWTKAPWYSFLAGVSQATNSNSALGQGGLGYAKRLGTIAADNTIENFLGSAIMPSLLHQDPRFYVLDHGNVLQRALYPAERIIITRGDSGRRQFNFSEILGAGIAAAISTYAYHPRSERNLADIGQVWYTELIYDTVSFEAKEFWPVLRRKLRKDKTQNQTLLSLQPLDE